MTPCPHRMTTALLVVAALLGGCATGLKIDTSHTAVGQDSRVQHLVLHFTAEDFPRSLKILTQGAVSSHYLVSDRQGDNAPKIYRLVDESRRAYHAGVSSWKGASSLNASSIGIEIVNRGYEEADAGLPLDQRRWQPYTEAQFHAVASLLQSLSNRYQIDPTRILGHSDISVARKVDPGPRFPWRRLHDEYGVGAWPDEERVTALLATMNTLPSTQDVQQMLIRYGYGLPASGELDTETRNAVAAFQLHFRPGRCDGEIDRETVARLQALLEKYPRR